jgi:hypothetical protein
MRTARLRSVDTNPFLFPSRVMSERFGASDRFAKQAARVCAIYSSELNSAAIEAETWWVRFIPKEGVEPRTYGSVAMTVTLGVGEVHEVPFDAAVLEMPEHERHFATLEWFHGEMLRLGAARGWDTPALDEVLRRCRDREPAYVVDCGSTWSPDRRNRARAAYEIDGDGNGWTSVAVVDRDGETLAVARFDSPSEPDAAVPIARSLRWRDAAAVAITPWPEKFAPRHAFAGERLVSCEHG